MAIIGCYLNKQCITVRHLNPPEGLWGLINDKVVSMLLWYYCYLSSSLQTVISACNKTVCCYLGVIYWGYGMLVKMIPFIVWLMVLAIWLSFSSAPQWWLDWIPTAVSTYDHYLCFLRQNWWIMLSLRKNSVACFTNPNAACTNLFPSLIEWTLCAN